MSHLINTPLYYFQGNDDIDDHVDNIDDLSGRGFELLGDGGDKLTLVEGLQELEFGRNP